MTANDTRLGQGYTLPDDLGSVRGVHRQPRFAGGAVVTENGTLASDDFVAGSTGWSIDGDGDVEFNSGVFRGNLDAATITSGTITVDSGADLRSSNYVADTSGWKVTGAGAAEFNSVKVRGTITSGGTLASANYSADSAGWQVTGAGAAEFNSVKVRGTITSGGALSSSNYSAGSAGWSVAGNGAAEFNNVTVRGDVIASSFTTHTGSATAWVEVGTNPSGGTGLGAIYISKGSIPVAVLYGVTSGGAILSETNSSGTATGAFVNLDTGDATVQAPNTVTLTASAGTISFNATGGINVNNKLLGAVHFDGEPEVDGDGNGIIIHSPNHSRWRLSVTNAGATVVTSA